MLLRELEDSILDGIRDLSGPCYVAVMSAVVDKLCDLYGIEDGNHGAPVATSMTLLARWSLPDHGDGLVTEAAAAEEAWVDVIEEHVDDVDDTVSLTWVTCCLLMADLAGHADRETSLGDSAFLRALLNYGTTIGRHENVFNVDEPVDETHPSIVLLRRLESTVLEARHRSDAGESCEQADLRPMLD